jgi:hypothetical protein
MVVVKGVFVVGESVTEGLAAGDLLTRGFPALGLLEPAEVLLE